VNICEKIEYQFDSPLMEESRSMRMPIPVSECPAFIRNYADGFKDLLPGSHYQSFVASLAASIFGVSGYSDTYRYLHFSPSVSSLGNFSNVEGLAAKLNRRHRRRLKAILEKAKAQPSRYQFALDDTLLPHSTGSKIYGSYRWHDHSSGGSIFGHKLLVIGIVDRHHRIFIPLIWEILHRDLGSEIEETLENVHEKGWQVAVRLIKQLVAEGCPKLVLAADSWFAGEEFFQELSHLEIPFVVEIKSNRIVENHGMKIVDQPIDEYMQGRRRTPLYHNEKIKYGCEGTLLLRGANHARKVIAVANRQELDDQPFAYYITNKLTWNASQIWSISRDRWEIEVQFRELKQFFTLGEAAVRSKQSVETTISVSVIALTVVRLRQLSTALADGNQDVRPIPAGAIIRDLQLETLLRCTSKLATIQQRAYLQKFQSRLNHKNLNTKPAEFRRNTGRPVHQGVEEKIPA
jgi:hypothetical protein